MTPNYSTNANLLQNLEALPEPIRKRIERKQKNFRYVLPYESNKFRGYQLPEEVAKPLAEKADAKCYKCLGTGIKDWRNGGLVARVCKCVLDQERFDAQLDEFAKAYEKLAAESVVKE